MSDAVAELERMDGVVQAEPDHVVRQTAVPNDRLLSYEWDMTAIVAHRARCDAGALAPAAEPSPVARPLDAPPGGCGDASLPSPAAGRPCSC